MAPAPGGVGGRCGASTGSAVAGRTRHGLADAGARIRRELLFLPAQRARRRRAEPRLPVGLRLRQRSSLRRRRRAPRARTAAGIYRNAPATGVARVVCYTPKHNTTLAELPVAAIADLLRAWRDQYLELGAQAGGPPRADVREQGRGGRRVEPASARADLRDELRLQDDRDRSRREPALLPGARPRALSATSSAPSRTTAAGFCSRARRRSCSSRTSRGTPTSATSRRRRRTPAWRRCRRASSTSWRRRSSRCWSATTTCGRCRSRTC